MNARWLWRLALGGVGLVAVAVALWAWNRWEKRTLRLELAQFTEREVAAQLSLEKDAAGQAWLVASFTPTRANYHLYSKDLPRDGLEGMGRPTLLEIASAQGLVAAGPLAATPEPIDEYAPTLDLTFPVYPAGTVTLRLPVTLDETLETASAELAVTYMACGEGKCLPPVVDKRIPVTFSVSGLR